MTHDEIVKENGSLVVAAKAYAEALASERHEQKTIGSIWEIPSEKREALHDVTMAAAGRLANLLADRLADPTDGMHTVHAGNYFGFLMEKAEAEA